MELSSLPRLSRADSAPLYAQITEILLDVIRAGRLRPEDRLPTQEELTRHFGVSLAPVKQALGELEERGIIIRRQGLGTFVRDTTPLREETILYTRIPWFTREMREVGILPTSEVLALRTALAGSDEEALRELRLEPQDQMVHLERVRLGNGEPLSIQDSYLSLGMVPGLVERGFGAQESLTEILANEYGLEIAAAQQRILAAAATEDDAAKLRVPAGSPLLVVHRTSYLKDGRVLEFLRDRRHPSWAFNVWLARQ
jgi:GntR family transcriptional regulator